MNKTVLALATVILSAASANVIEGVTPKDHRINFSLLQLGYDHIKKDSLYAGVDLKFSPSWNIDNNEAHKKNYMMNLEVRIGQNFSLSSNNTLTPYIALGYTHFHHQHNDFYVKEMTYMAFGGKLLHAFGPTFETGLYIKGSRGLIQTIQLKFNDYNLRDMKWGFEVGVPLCWHLGSEKNWDIHLEPYFTKIPSAAKLEYLGYRLSCGYQF